MAAAVEAKKQTSLTLDAFRPNAQETHVITTLESRGFLPIEVLGRSIQRVGALNRLHLRAKEKAQENNPEEAIASARKWGEEYWDTEAGITLRERINRPVYEAIEDVFNLKALGITGEHFFREAMETADAAVMEVVGRLGPEATPVVSLLDETRRAKDPTDFIRYLTNPNVSDKLRFELFRKLALGITAGELSMQSGMDKVDRTLARNVGIFDEDLFAGTEVGNPQVHTFQVIHDSNTNEVLWVEGVHSKTERRRHKKGTARVETYSYQMREIPEVGMVLSLPRQKKPEASVNKAVDKALTRRRSGKREDIRTAEDVQDRAGQKIVVFNAKSLDDPTMNLAIRKVIGLLADRYHINMADASEMAKHFVVDNNKNPEKRQSATKHGFRRIQFYAPGATYPVEYIFESIVDYINNEKHVGKKTNNEVRYNGYVYDVPQYDGRAHILFEDRRVQSLLTLYFAEAIYDPTHQLNLATQLLEASTALHLRHANDLLHPQEATGMVRRLR